MAAFCLIILVGISRSWEAFEISSSRISFLTSSRLTFSQENLQQEFSSFILRMLGCFSKVLIVFTIGVTVILGNFAAFNVKTIYNTVEIRPKDFPQLHFLPKWLHHFQQVLLHLFSEAWLYGFPKRLIIGNLFNIKVIIKVPFCLFHKFNTKIALVFLHANSLRNEFSFLNSLKKDGSKP